MLALIAATALASAPLPTCTQPLTPFARGRGSLASLVERAYSPFGAYRASYVRGHLHAGVDLEGNFGEPVFALCEGRVVDIHLPSPYRTVVIEHRLPSGERFFSSYKHVEGVTLAVGEAVDADTQVGRLLSRAQQARTQFPRCHLHLEIRHRIDDNGAASWKSMSHQALHAFCRDPMDFFAQHLGQARVHRAARGTRGHPD